jgi:hypothetical protein
MLELGVNTRPRRSRRHDALQAIGNTPHVELTRFSPKAGVRIWASARATARRGR